LHEPLARREIPWAGQPVALVIAETPEAAADAAALVMVETTRSNHPRSRSRDRPRRYGRGRTGGREAGATGDRSTPPSVAEPRSSP
jgi:CO/xanthine dehydrogenase Mo-binding subunit